MLAALYLLKTWTLTCKKKREKGILLHTSFQTEQLETNKKSIKISWSEAPQQLSGEIRATEFHVRLRRIFFTMSIKSTTCLIHKSVMTRRRAHTQTTSCRRERRSGAAAIKHGHEIAFVYIVKLLFWGLVVSHSDFFFVPRRGKAPWKELPSTVRLA